MSKRLTIEEVKIRCLDKGFEFLGSDTKVSNKQEFKCIKHGEIYLSTINGISSGSGLRCCKREWPRENKSFSIEVVKEKSLSHGFEFVDSEYRGSQEKHLYRCIKHNKIQLARPNNIFRDKRLNCCKRESSLTAHVLTVDKAIDICEKNNFEFLSKEWVGCCSKYEVLCKKHNEIHLVQWSHFQQNKSIKCCWLEKVKNIQHFMTQNLDNAKIECLSSGFELLADSWRGCDERYDFKCLKHNEVHTKKWNTIQRYSSLPCCRKEKISGENSHLWNHSLTDEQRASNKIFRLSKDYFNWARGVKRRYGMKCFICDSTENLHSHHIESYRSNMELGLDKNNGIALCLKCHRAFHKKYGNGNNTRLQFEKFLEEYDDNSKSLNYHKKNY